MLSSLARYCPIHRRTHQRVAELEPIGTHANEICRLGGDKTTLVDVQLGCGAGNRPPATGALRRGIKSIARAGGGSRSTRSRYACSSDVGVGSAPTSGSCPLSCRGEGDRGISTRASGLPFALSTTHSTAAGDAYGPSRSTSSSRASKRARADSRSSGRPGATYGRESSSLAARSRARDSASSRRAAKKSASAEAPSSHCASSTRQTRGRSSAASASRLSTPSETRKRSPSVSSESANAERSAAACGPGSASIAPSSGRRIWCRAANASSDSAPPPRPRAESSSRPPCSLRRRAKPTCRSRPRRARPAHHFARLERHREAADRSVSPLLPTSIAPAIVTRHELGLTTGDLPDAPSGSGI